MKRYPNKMVTNVKSPKREREYIQAYKVLNPDAKLPDGHDVSAVKTTSGTYGHALLPQDINRGRDKSNHVGKAFIPNDELRKRFKK